MSGAFCLSSNRSGVDASGFEWGGRGWIIEPEEGEVLGLTSPQRPFLTIDVDLDGDDDVIAGTTLSEPLVGNQVPSVPTDGKLYAPTPTSQRLPVT